MGLFLSPRLRVVSLLLLGVLLSSVSSAAPALAAAEDETLRPAESLLAEDSRAFPHAEAWRTEWRQTPALVSLNLADGEGGGDSVDALKVQLSQLGLKTFSNREWRGYWERQEQSAKRLAEVLANEPRWPMAMRAAMEDWAVLAQQKVANQDRYFNAIEAARDAAEERLEAAIELQGAESPGTTASLELPTPYQRRKLQLADLQSRIGQQKSKRALAMAENRYIERQLKSENQLNEALAKDVELAAMELTVAGDQVRGDGPASWRRFWTEVERSSAFKLERIKAEAGAGTMRARRLEVEAALGDSQLSFRNARIESLQAEYEAGASFSGWLSATSETLMTWLRQDSWRLLLGLLLIWIAVKFALRLIHRVSDLILARAEGNPDDPTDVDQRSKTLASVFTGIARIAVYIVGGLLALEQIGVNTGPLLGSVAILGLAISFGSQNLVRDVVNGFFILLENQYAVGELVVIGGNTGTVEKITIRSTWIRAWTGEVYVIPNGSIGSLTNKARDWAVAPVHVGVGYGADLDRVREVVDQVGEQLFASEEWSEVLDEAPSYVGVTELADSSVNVRVVARVRPGNQSSISRELNYRLKLAFDEAGIDIPYPQRVVHSAGD